MSVARIAFLVSSLSGSGHLVRTLALARAVEAAGGRALVLSGGRALPHLGAPGCALVQLPPLSVPDLDFSTLRDDAGRPADAAYLAARRAAIVEAVERFAPDVLVTETFPLGRRRLADEHLAAIAAVRGRAAVVASVRDVPEPPSRPERIAEAAAQLSAEYALVLVHGDAGFLPLSAAWPLPPGLADRIRHTGYVGHHGAVRAAAAPDRNRILVSVGGGPLGRSLLGCAAAAAQASPRPWHLLVGGADASRTADALAASAPPGLIVEPVRPDYRALLAGAAASVSLAGYNTVMDLAACDTPALLVPSEEGGEREQSLRADRLAGLPGLAVCRAGTLDPARLAARVEALAAGPRRPPFPFALGGAARAARVLMATARERSGAA